MTRGILKWFQFGRCPEFCTSAGAGVEVLRIAEEVS